MNAHWSQPSTDLHFVSSAWSRLSVIRSQSFLCVSLCFHRVSALKLTAPCAQRVKGHDDTLDLSNQGFFGRVAATMNAFWGFGACFNRLHMSYPLVGLNLHI